MLQGTPESFCFFISRRGCAGHMLLCEDTEHEHRCSATNTTKFYRSEHAPLSRHHSPRGLPFLHNFASPLLLSGILAYAKLIVINELLIYSCCFFFTLNSLLRVSCEMWCSMFYSKHMGLAGIASKSHVG